MPEQLLIAIMLLAAFVVYVVIKVWSYMRQSDADWSRVDKSRLNDWEDEDDWSEP